MRLKSFIIAVTAIAVVTVTGCSSSSSSKSSSDTTTAVRTVCTELADLKASVAALTNPQVLTEGKDGIQAAVDSVKGDLDRVAASAGANYKPQVDAVKSSVNDLQTAVDNLGSGNPPSNIQAVATAIASVGASAGTLISALQTGCPST